MTGKKWGYAEGWGGAAFCLFAFVLWVAVPTLVLLYVGEVGTTERVAVQHVTGIAVLVPLFLLQRRFVHGLPVVGAVSGRICLAALLTVAALYAVTELIEWLQDIPLEPWLSFVTNANASQLAVIAVLAIIAAPISEELAFRHFLLAALPFKRNLLYAFLTVLGGAFVFMLMHSYEFWMTNLLMFLLAIVFAIARIRTGGLIVPILMHGTASAIGLTIILIKS